MDISSVIGACVIVVSVIWAIMSAGNMAWFIDIPSALLVGGGVIGATFLKWPLEVVLSIGQIMVKVFIYPPNDPKQAITKITELAETARRESVFALEKVEVDDPFMKKAMTLAADNRPPEVIQAILQLEIDIMDERHKKGIAALDGIAADGPAFGMLGTLIGLVIMLQNLSDPSSIGPAMAVALITTFYGSAIANAFALPMKNKLAVRNDMEKTKMGIIIAGTLGIVAGENPRLIKEKLSAFLPPSQREVEKAGEE